MDMSLPPEALGALFEMSRDAVVGIENNIISFANPAAAALLDVQPGDPADRAVPGYILADPSPRFTATLRVCGRPGAVSVARQGGLCLLCFTVEQSQAPSAMPARIAGELGACLSAARLAIDAIVRDGGGQEQTASLYRSYYRMKRLCDHIRAADSIRRDSLPAALQVIDLEALCRDLCDTAAGLCASLGVAVRFRGSGERCPALVDPELTETMLLTVLSNSLLHTARGGTVLLALTRHQGRAILSFQDEGPGIPPGALNAVSDEAMPDMTDTAAGAGLGLFVARGIAERLGGALILDSGPGGGLRISLPMASPEDVKLSSPRVPYRTDGMNGFLTELSVVLDRDCYRSRLMD